MTGRSTSRATQTALRQAHELSWFEEPIRVDASEADWLALVAASNTPLAGGENFHGEQFTRALASPVLQVIQPDITKWGGVKGNWAVACRCWPRCTCSLPQVV